MVLKIDNMSLEVVRTTVSNTVNDVYICRDNNAVSETYYTLIYIKDHVTAKKFLDCFQKQTVENKVLIRNFSHENAFCFLLDYRKERALDEFYVGSSFSIYRCEEICIRLILECISCNIPYPLLYEILKQRQVNMSKDNSIYFNYNVELSDFDNTRDEQDCVVKCAMIVKELLKMHDGTNSVSYRLLNKKVPKNSYMTFYELYRDIKLTVTPDKELGIINRIKKLYKKHSKKLFNLLIFVCVVAALLTLIVIISQIAFKDSALYRLFINTFKTIGTETMLQ